MTEPLAVAGFVATVAQTLVAIKGDPDAKKTLDRLLNRDDHRRKRKALQQAWTDAQHDVAHHFNDEARAAAQSVLVCLCAAEADARFEVTGNRLAQTLFDPRADHQNQLSDAVNAFVRQDLYVNGYNADEPQPKRAFASEVIRAVLERFRDKLLVSSEFADLRDLEQIHALRQLAKPEYATRDGIVSYLEHFRVVADVS